MKIVFFLYVSIIIQFWIVLVIHCWMIVAENQFNPKLDVLQHPFLDENELHP